VLESLGYNVSMICFDESNEEIDDGENRDEDMDINEDCNLSQISDASKSAPVS
jgi:hypothetical protein